MECKLTQLSEKKSARAIAIAGAVLVFIVCAALLTQGSFDYRFSDRFGDVFYNMWKHLISGSVEIDPEVIEDEAFIIDGKTVAYFLPFPALVRGFFDIFGIGKYPIPSILLSIVVSMVALYYLFVNMARSMNKADRLPYALLFLPGLCSQLILFSAISSVYWEAITWSLAIYFVFLNFLIRYLSSGTHNDKKYLYIASFFALFTRPTYVVAVCLTMVVLICMDLYHKSRKQLTLGLYAMFFCGLTLLGSLNYLRWSNPFEFMPAEHAIQAIQNPNRLDKLKNLPPLSISRIPDSLSYFLGASPANISINSNRLKADHPYGRFNSTNYDYVEPRYGIIIATPVIFLIALWGGYRLLYQLILNRGISFKNAIPYMTSLIPPGLVLCIFVLATRYRSEFVPIMSMLAIYYFIDASHRNRISTYAIYSALILNLASIYFTVMSAVDERSVLSYIWTNR